MDNDLLQQLSALMRSESQERIQLSHGKVSLNPANIQRTLSPTIP